MHPGNPLEVAMDANKNPFHQPNTKKQASKVYIVDADIIIRA